MSALVPAHPGSRGYARARTLALASWLTLLVACAAHRPASVDAWRQGLATTNTADGDRLAYLDRGPRDGEVILLLHGLPTSSQMYARVADALAAAGYRVVAPDLLGFGASSKPSDLAAYRFDRQAERVRALLDELEVATVTLVVHDLGGLVGWELLDRAPTRIARLLVLNTTAYDGFRPPFEMRMLAGPLGGVMASMMAGPTMGPGQTATFLKGNTGDPAHVDAATVDGVWWSLHEGTTRPMRAMARSFAAIGAEFPRYQAALRRFSGPARVLWGGRDRVLRGEVLVPRFLADLGLPASAARIVPDAGHFIVLDDPVAVTEAILALVHEAPASEARAERPAAGLDRAAPGRPALGPSVRLAADVADRVSRDAAIHDVRAGLRARGLIGERWGYAVGLDADVGWAEGLAYRVAGYPLGLGLASRGRSVTVAGGLGVRRLAASGAQLEVPMTVDAIAPMGPVSALGWVRAAWIPADSTAIAWEAAVGLRLGRTRAYFPGAYLGAGPYLAAVVAGGEDLQQVGVVVGLDLGDSH